MESDQLINSADRVMFNNYLNELNLQLNDSTDINDKNVREIVNLLATEIKTIADSMNKTCNNVPVMTEITDLTVLEDIINLDASVTTHLDSAIICATGDGTDTGEDCQISHLSQLLKSPPRKDGGRMKI